VQQQDLLVLLLRARQRDFSWHVAHQTANVPLHRPPAASEGLDREGLVEADHAHEVVAGAGFEDAQQLVRELVLDVGGAGGLELPQFCAIDGYSLFGLGDDAEGGAFGLDEFRVVLVPAGVGLSLAVEVCSNADEFRLDADAANVVVGESEDGLELSSLPVLPKDQLLDLGGLEFHALFGERHDAELEVLVDSHPFFADFNIVLVEFSVGEAVELLVVDVLVDHLVADGVAAVVEEDGLELLQQYFKRLFLLDLQGQVRLHVL
jgi:hypothetical protein